MIVLRTLLIILVTFSLNSCYLTSDIPLDQTTLLTKKLWAFDSLVGYDDFGIQLGLALNDKMTYNFLENGHCTIVTLGVSRDNTWEFNNDGSAILFNTGTADVQEWTIISLNETELVISFEDVDALNGRVTWTFK
jgi:hypothetical protein